MRKVLRLLWSNEPVLLGTLVPVLTTAGLTASQARSIQGAVEGLVAIGAEVATAFGVRKKVAPAVTK